MTRSCPRAIIVPKRASSACSLTTSYKKICRDREYSNWCNLLFLLAKDRLRYVFSLLQRLQRKQHENGSPGNTSSYRNIPDNSDSPEPTENNQGSQTSRYMGNLSCLSNLLSVVNDTRIQAQHIPVLPTIYVGEGLNSVINQETHDYLVKTYLTDIHCLYPFLDESLQFFSPEWRIDIDSTELALRQRFILELVYSIASHHIMDSVVTDHQRHCYRTLADGCHRRGLMLFDKVAMDISIPALQAVTLAALHCLFSPQQGNCGQLIGLAARLAIDLSPSDKSCTIRRGRTKMQPIYTSIYCIESQIAATLDRPSLLPEPVMVSPFSRCHFTVNRPDFSNI